MTIVRGRPREFCVDAALSAALGVFWSKGYEGASLTDLTEAMGVTRPSLYAAFGNKEALFRKALDLYEREKLAFMSAALQAPTARDVAARMLTSALEMQTSTSGPRGCLNVISSVACGPEAHSIKAEILSRRASSEAALQERFERAKAEGELRDGVDPASLVRYLITVLQGMAVQASSGVPKADLEQLVKTILQLWPSR
ncbi:TetR/AcrR family transcriptional regulator [Caulobacter sp. S45]|uniref:TetR/AcrR family transcriptional regulator n=1 Tax=Caulobacter sp. S45 TaxID=1641861 RepID=UPI001C2061F9|nr:TetR/AcrR family transcriptional regulator [Caulobacter sp. S45]